VAGVILLAYKPALSAALFNASGSCYILAGALEQSRIAYADYVARQKGQPPRRDVVWDEAKQKWVYGPRLFGYWKGYSWLPTFKEEQGWQTIIQGAALMVAGSVILVVLAI
jgi:hypothetical protein